MLSRTQRSVRRPRFTPQLECLEDRSLPSVSAIFNAGVLTITGDNDANDVAIVADAGGDITVTGTDCDTCADPFSGVTSIVVNLQGGDDTLSADFSANSALNLDMHVTTGAGDDSVNLTLGDLDTSAHFGFKAELNAGDDSVQATIGAIGQLADVSIGVEGGNGDDSVGVTTGDLDIGASLDVKANLGNGDDSVQAALGAIGEGAVADFNVHTGNGDDTMGLQASVGDGGELNVDADLGQGNDGYSADIGAVGEDAFVDMNVSGGAGNDAAAANFGDIGASSAVDLDFHLGAGADTLALAFGAIGESASLDLLANAGAGDDAIAALFGEIAADAVVSQFYSLGQGDDTLAMTANQTIDADATMLVNALGGSGEDAATFDFGTNTNFTANVSPSVETVVGI